LQKYNGEELTDKQDTKGEGTEHYMSWREISLDINRKRMLLLYKATEGFAESGKDLVELEIDLGLVNNPLIFVFLFGHRLVFKEHNLSLE